MHRPSTRRATAFILIAGGLVACSALTDFAGLVGDGAAIDAALDHKGTSSDGSGGADQAAASLDASAADVALDAGPPFCADAAGLAFCEDFDEQTEAAAFARWDLTTLNNGALSIDNGNAVSPPASLLATIPVNNPSYGALLEKDFAGHTRATIAADVLLEDYDQAGYGSILEIHLKPNPDGYSDYRVALLFTAGVMTLDVYSENDEAGTYQNSSTIALNFSTWQRVAIEIGTNPTPYAKAYDSKGTVLGTLQLPAGAVATGQSVIVGLPYVANNTVSWRARIDNVAVTVGD